MIARLLCGIEAYDSTKAELRSIGWLAITVIRAWWTR